MDSDGVVGGRVQHAARGRHDEGHEGTGGLGPGATGSIRVDENAPHVLRIVGAADALTVEQTCARAGVDAITLGRTFAAEGVRELDLTDATFIDSAVLALVVSLMPALRPQRLKVRGATGPALTALTITGLDALVELC